jgi:geranylgeranyl diphosphate synthase type I
LAPNVGKIFDELLTSRELDAEQIGFLQQCMVDSGALDKSERMIEDLANQSLEALSHLEISEEARTNLQQLAAKAIRRDS